MTTTSTFALTDYVLVPKAQPGDDKKEKIITNDNKKAETKEVTPRLAFPKTRLAGLTKIGKRGWYFRTTLHYGSSLATQSSTGKYLLNWTAPSSTAFQVSNVQNGGEWSSFNGIFEEFFIHKMILRFEPLNQFLAGYVSSTTSNLQTAPCTIAGYQHSQPVPSDAAQLVYQTLNASQSMVEHTGRPWRFVWNNVEKFDPLGPVGDATTAAHSQTWLNFGDVSKYGGYVIACTPYTNGTAAAGVFPTSATLGYVYFDFDVSMRYRD